MSMSKSIFCEHVLVLGCHIGSHTRAHAHTYITGDIGDRICKDNRVEIRCCFNVQWRPQLIATGMNMRSTQSAERDTEAGLPFSLSQSLDTLHNTRHLSENSDVCEV